MTRCSKTALVMISLLSLSACKTVDTPVVGKAADSMMGMRKDTEARLSTAASEAIAAGKTVEAAKLYEDLYKKNKHDKTIALNYAQLLRKTGNPKMASSVLKPFLTTKEGAMIEKADPMLLNEFAASEIALGQMKSAETALNGVLEDEKSENLHADAYNLMGVTLDAQGQHKEAEQMFRLAMDGWKGNPTSVMNNLALCLASQGMFDDSLTTLRRALVMAPDKQEIARNIQIVSDLRDAIVPTAPVVLKK